MRCLDAIVRRDLIVAVVAVVAESRLSYSVGSGARDSRDQDVSTARCPLNPSHSDTSLQDLHDQVSCPRVPDPHVLRHIAHDVVERRALRCSHLLELPVLGNLRGYFSMFTSVNGCLITNIPRRLLYRLKYNITYHASKRRHISKGKQKLSAETNHGEHESNWITHSRRRNARGRERIRAWLRTAAGRSGIAFMARILIL